MDLYQLDCFRTVAHMEHISNAAVVLHITQPALSKIITRVEEYACAPLFDRVKGKIRLNASGTAFLETLDGVFDQIEKGKKQVVDISEQNSNYIRLAASCDSIMFMLAESFFSEHPEVRVRYSVMPHDQIREAFMRNALDFALTTYPLQEKGVEWEHIADEEILMVVGRDSPFYGRKAVSFTELKDVEMMCESSGDLRDKLNACCETAGFAPNIVMESTIGAVMGFSAGLRRAVSFVPAHRFMQMNEAHEKMARERPEQDMVERAPDLCAVRLYAPQCIWSTGLACRPEKELGPSAELFYSMTKEYFARLGSKMEKFMAEYFGPEL